jgi:outer membrane protein TolC
MRKALLPLLLLLLPASAHAQKAAGAPPAPPGAAAASPSPLTVPPPPAVSDPMLAPVPPPKRVLSSWPEAISYLRARSTDLKIALDQVLQAEAATRIALAQYLPNVGTASAPFGGSATHQLLVNRSAGLGLTSSGITNTSTEPIQNTGSASIQVEQTVLNVQAFDQISIDELNEDATKLSVDDKKRTLALSLANQIVAVVTAERSADINRVGLRVALEQSAITKSKQSLGAANGLDVVRAEQNAANARAALVTGDESLREAREALGLALGVPEETGVAPGLNVDGLAESALGSCHVVSDVDERPDIASARTNVTVAKRNLRNVWFSFLPTALVQSTVSGGTPVPTGYPNPTWNVQAVVSIPLWDGGVRYGNLRNARAAEDIAAQTLESLRRAAIIQIQQAQRQLTVAELSDKVATEQRDLAARNDQMTQTAYTVGQGTSLELVTASEAHRQAELNLALADFSVVKARLLAVLALATCPW